mmetsp:Transcript_64208/g.178366  ORF Transcript_64208/g.178366 Transcript_64208/m.178366 type:complete len:80 (+) Transcript_64208:500-739(+)
MRRACGAILLRRNERLRQGRGDGGVVDCTPDEVAVLLVKSQRFPDCVQSSRDVVRPAGQRRTSKAQGDGACTSTGESLC